MSPDEKDFFSLLGMPRQYPLGRKQLEESHQHMSWQAHPDLADENPQAQQEALARSALLNQAYQTLNDDTQRAELLLLLLLEKRSLKSDQLPPGFLNEMFLLQEQANELLETVPAPQSQAGKSQAGESQAGESQAGKDLQALLQTTEQRLQALLNKRTQLFAAAQASQPAPLETLQIIQDHLNCERYFRRLLQSLRGEERQL